MVAARAAIPSRCSIRWPELDEARLPQFETGSTYVYDEHVLLSALNAWPPTPSPSPATCRRSSTRSTGRTKARRPARRSRSRWPGAGTRRGRRCARSDRPRSRSPVRGLRTPIGSALITDFLKFPREDSPDLHPALQAVTRLAEPSVEVVLLPEDSPLIPAKPLDLTRQRVRELLLNSVSVSSRLAVFDLLRQDPPPAFAGAGLAGSDRIRRGNGSWTCHAIAGAGCPCLSARCRA